MFWCQIFLKILLNSSFDHRSFWTFRLPHENVFYFKKIRAATIWELVVARVRYVWGGIVIPLAYKITIYIPMLCIICIWRFISVSLHLLDNFGLLAHCEAQVKLFLNVIWIMEIGERHFSLDSQIEGTYLPIFWSTVVEFFILILY